MIDYKKLKYPFLTIMTMFTVGLMVFVIPLTAVLLCIKLWGSLTFSYAIVFFPLVFTVLFPLVGFILDLVRNFLKKDRK